MKFYNALIKRITLLTLVVAMACSSKVSSTKSNSGDGGKYTEDLSVLRPKETPVDTTKSKPASQTTGKKEFVEAKFTVNDRLDPILDSIAEINLQNGYIDGYTIQVYSGTKREEALNSKKELSMYLPDLDSEVQFVQPNFRVRTGRYYGKLDAQKDYQAVKRYFPNAILLPDRIPIQ